VRAEEGQRVRAEEGQRVRAEEGQRGRAEEGLEVRRVVPDDWPALKALRLEALQECPTAFCERYADAVRADDDQWQARAARGAEGGDAFQVLAWLRGLPVAMSVGHLDEGDAVLAAVYVTPVCRGRGLLDAMVDQVAAWARERCCPRLRLLVHETNLPAQRAYARLGFVPTGHREPYPLDLASEEVELARVLGPGEPRVR
jgi:ribosomal protein S18 acetylase RimI-like enzyme